MAKITVIYDNGMGDIAQVSSRNEDLINMDYLVDWLNSTCLAGLGFSVEDKSK